MRFFSAKSPRVTYKLVSQENVFRKSKHPLPSLCQTIRSPSSNWKLFQVFETVQFEFKVRVKYGLWQNASNSDPLIDPHMCKDDNCKLQKKEEKEENIQIFH